MVLFKIFFIKRFSTKSVNKCLLFLLIFCSYLVNRVFTVLKLSNYITFIEMIVAFLVMVFILTLEARQPTINKCAIKNASLFGIMCI